MEKQNLTQQKHVFTNQNKCTTTQNKHKKLKPDLVASYDIRPGNGEGLFLFWRFINLSLTYLLRHLPTYLQSRTHMRHPANSVWREHKTLTPTQRPGHMHPSSSTTRLLNVVVADASSP